MPKQSPYILDVTPCPRCRMDHAALEFWQFRDEPIHIKKDMLDTYVEMIAFDWWATCPITGDPIIMRFNEELKGTNDIL